MFVFLLIFSIVRKRRSRYETLAILVLLLACPLALHGLSYHIFAENSQASWAGVNSALYTALPYVVIAGLSLFPLLAIESITLSIPIFLWVVALFLLNNQIDWAGLFSQIWILCLLLGVSTLSGLIQSYYLDSLLKRSDNDPLTGAVTRRSGTEMMEFMFDASEAKDFPFALAFIDLDHFKSLNDTYGHDAGDNALRQAVDILQSKVRGEDIVVRWGGEEFILVLPETDCDKSKIIIERITSEWLGSRPDGTPLTASIGVAERKSDKVDSWENILKIADSRMYEAKQAGRARCVFNSK